MLDVSRFPASSWASVPPEWRRKKLWKALSSFRGSSLPQLPRLDSRPRPRVVAVSSSACLGQPCIRVITDDDCVDGGALCDNCRLMNGTIWCPDTGSSPLVDRCTD